MTSPHNNGDTIDDGRDEFDRPVAVPARELLDWAVLVGELADWLGNATATTSSDLVRFFSGRAGHTPETMVLFCTHIRDRITALLGRDQAPRWDTADPDNPDRPVQVPAPELSEWAWLNSELADWLGNATAIIKTDLAGHFNGLRDPTR